MGGNDYDRDVGTSSSSGGFDTGGTSSYTAKSAMGRSCADRGTFPKGRIITSTTESPIVIALDVTGSNIEFAHIVYDKAPMLYGQIQQQGYLKDFDICFSAVGDAYCDSAPLQVCDFKQGKPLDEELKKIYLESGGGGQLTETYELCARYFATKCNMPNAKLPFMFMIGDEAPYPTLDRMIARNYLGENIPENLNSHEVFAELMKKFNGNVYFLQNPYYGREGSETEDIRRKWIDYIGRANAEKVIRINEEKSIVDVILGVIAMVSQTRTIDSYVADMKSRGQSLVRVRNVSDSLSGLKNAIVPYAHASLPDLAGGKKRGSGARRI